MLGGMKLIVKRMCMFLVKLWRSGWFIVWVWVLVSLDLKEFILGLLVDGLSVVFVESMFECC